VFIFLYLIDSAQNFNDAFSKPLYSLSSLRYQNYYQPYFQSAKNRFTLQCSRLVWDLARVIAAISKLLKKKILQNKLSGEE
jgi:hypothetical protein